MTDHIFVVNPAAGKEDRTEPIKKAAMNVKTDGKVEIYTTSCPGDATKFLEERLKDAPHPVRVYACGGDGT
ncbi:MAG: diacylglycerol kinase family lipid kinase, partial [Clostridia bacterium]|nr:diacylglycerol kinase family lipid kinase [Clostridia bacterium]